MRQSIKDLMGMLDPFKEETPVMFEVGVAHVFFHLFITLIRLSGLC